MRHFRLRTRAFGLSIFLGMILLSQARGEPRPLCPLLLGPSTRAPLKASEVSAKFPESWKTIIRGFVSELEVRNAKNYPADFSAKNLRRDITIIGGGIHGSIAAASITVKNPEISTLVLSAGGPKATPFNGSFFVNSPRGTASTFAGSVVQIRNFDHAKYVPAELYADIATLNLASYTGDIAFATKATRLAERPQNASLTSWPTRYRIQTADGKYVGSEKIILVPGMGEPKFPFKEESKLDLIRSEQAKPVPRLQDSDSFLARAKQAQEAGKNPLDLIPEEVVYVIGSGHSGNTAVEFLRGLAPPETYGAFPIRKKKIVWIGPSVKTSEEFIANYRNQYQAPKWDRYDPLGRELDTGEIEMVNAHVVDLRKSSSDKGEGYELVLKHADGTITSRVAGSTLFATGYESGLDELLRTLDFDSYEFEGVVGTVEDPRVQGETVIGKRLVTTKAGVITRHEIYVSGPAAGKLASENEIARSVTHNPVSINVQAPRTQAMAKYITPLPRGIPELKALPLNSGPYIVAIDVPNIVWKNKIDSTASEYSARVHFLRTITHFSIPEKFSITFRWMKAVDVLTAKLVAEIAGLETESARTLLRNIMKNQTLVDDITHTFEEDQSFGIQFKFQGDAAGRLVNLESVKVP